MAEAAGPLREFLIRLETALRQAASGADEASAALAEFAQLSRTIDSGTAARPRASEGTLPVCRFWNGALTAATGQQTAPLVATLRSLGPLLSWTQNPNYRRHPPDPAFLNNYGYAVLAGPPGGPPALTVDPRLALGVLLLGPHTHYPLHHHPAVEVYCVVSGDAEWWREAGPWRRHPSGTVIYHAPNVPHAMRAGEHPLLALYLWRGDLATHARLGAR